MLHLAMSSTQEPGRCVNANDVVEQGDVDDGGEKYKHDSQVYINKTPAQTQRPSAQGANARNQHA